MPPGLWFNSAFAAKWHGVHDLATNTVKVALSNVAPVATNTQLSQITQIAATGGYTTGGFTVASKTSAQTGGVYTLGGDNVTVLAVSTTMPDWRYIVVYDDGATNDELLFYIDAGSTQSLAAGESVVITWDPASTLITDQAA
jgi:hypothetical protein